ncbi:MAG: ATP-binding cassette domain-containing protein [Bacteroidota bacterium]
MEIVKVGFKYLRSQKWVLTDITLNFHPHNIYGIIGPNGAGKTTLLSIISGLLLPSDGSIENEKDVGIQLQGISMYDQASATENLQLYCLETNTTSKNIDYVLSLVGIDKDQAKVPLKECSQGYKQRLLIARSLLRCNGTVVLDEPFTSLDFGTIKRLKKGLELLVKEKPIKLIISSHQLREIEGFVDHGIFIEEGKIIKKIDARKNSLESTYNELFEGDA